MSSLEMGVVEERPNSWLQHLKAGGTPKSKIAKALASNLNLARDEPAGPEAVESLSTVWNRLCQAELFHERSIKL